MSFVRHVRPSYAVTIELASLDSVQPNVPDIACLVPGGVENDAPRWYRIAGTIEKIQAHADGMAAEDRKIYAAASDVGSQRKRHSRSNRLNFTQTQQVLQLGQLFRT
jgi:hypothetical protein